MLMALVLVACGDDDTRLGDAGHGGDASSSGPDVFGLYEVVSHTENERGCDPGAAVDEPLFFELRESALGVSYLECSAADASTCSGRSPVANVTPLTDATPTGWRGDTAGGGGGGDSCSLTYTESVLTVEAVGAVVIETRRHSESGAITPCSSDEARRRGADMPCRALTVLRGSAL